MRPAANRKNWSAPGEFQLTSAAPGAGLFSVTAKLAWNPSEHACRYRVSVSESAEFTDTVAMEIAATPSLAVSGFNGPAYDHENDGEPRRNPAFVPAAECGTLHAKCPTAESCR